MGCDLGLWSDKSRASKKVINKLSDGWIKIHRKLAEWPFKKDPDFVAVWIELLITANYGKKSYNIAGDTIALNAGQLVTGRKKLAANTGVHESKIFRVLKRLESEQQIEQQTFNKFSIITILKWNDYQVGEQQNEQQVNNKRTTDEQQVNTNKERKNIKKKEGKNKDTTDFFEIFWKTTNFPKRTQDAKGDIKKKYISVLKNTDLKPEDIAFSANIFAEANKNNKFPIGLRKFMEAETIKQYLSEDIPREKTLFEKNSENARKALSILENRS